MSKTFTTILLCLLGLTAAAHPQKQEADLIIINAKVHTVDPERPEARAVAIRDGRIIAVEKKDKRVQKYVGKRTKRINARGKLVLPGFNDAHVHFMGIGNLFSSIDLKDVRDPREIAARMAFYVRFIPKGRWILGGGWNQELWDSGKLPTRQMIDDVTWENPVFVYNHDGTMALANTLALKMARIDRDKSAIEGGEIVRDAEGEPTGVLKGQAMLFVKTHAPQTATREYAAVAEAATNYAAYLGVTSVQDMHSDDLSGVLGELAARDRLKTRVYDCTPLADWQQLADKGVTAATGSGMLRTGCLKSFVTGEPDEEEELLERIAAADRAGLQVMIHAIGGRANGSILSVFERAAAANGPRDRRFRVEHAYGFSAADLGRFARSDIVASLQPHLFRGGDPYRSLMRSGAPVAFGSDASITDLNPLYGIRAAVTGGRGEKIPVGDAVRFYTLGAAHAEFQEKVKGSVSVGKYADLVILSEDIFEIDPEKIAGVEVLMTIVDGRIVYNQREFTTVPSPNLPPLKNDPLADEGAHFH